MNRKLVIFISLFAFFSISFAFTGIEATHNKTISISSYSLQYQKPNTSNIVEKVINNDFLDNNTKVSKVIQTNVTTDNSLRIKRKRIRKNRKRRKVKINENSPQVVTETFLINTTASESSVLEVSKRRRRKRRKQKKKSYQNNSSDVATSPVTNKNFSLQTDNGLSDLKERFTNKFQKIINTPATTLNSTLVTKKRNRCLKNNGGCSQICKSKGKTKCFCIQGYKLGKDRKKCVDINECHVKNGGCKEICRNTVGTYYCDCHRGFRLADDLKSCQDVNECHLRNGHGPCQDTCTNTFGSYLCDCSHLNGTRLGKDKHSCDDINECEEANPGCTHSCINTRMGAFCVCPEGMELMTDYKSCQDIDECEDPSVKSFCIRGCVNTIGSYYCEEDFQNDQNVNKTKIPACPPLDLPPQGFITCFRNNSLLFNTYTKNGRKIIKNSPGTKCQLECPVGFKLQGGGRFVCGTSGKWIIKKKGLCIKSSYPRLECPPDQTLILKKGHRMVPIHFSAPRTNIRWKIVKSYPKWAKNLKGKLGEGQHSIQFSVTDPASKLSSTCSFSVVVKK